LALATKEEQMTYDEFIAEQERMCGSSVTLGGSDPYGATCELDAGHRGPHVSANPFGGDGVYEWSGGGYCAGDPLPVRGARFLERACDREFGPHEHDNAECERMLDTMNGGGDDGSWLADALNREAEEGMLGRPLMPNEY
jgi:hypothetical protein